MHLVPIISDRGEDLDPFSQEIHQYCLLKHCEIWKKGQVKH